MINKRAKKQGNRLIARTRKPNMLVKKQVAAVPSGKRKMYGDGEDFYYQTLTTSSSDWITTDEPTTVSDTNSEVKAIPKQSGLYKRQYSRSNGKIITPSLTNHNCNCNKQIVKNIIEEKWQQWRKLFCNTLVIEDQMMMLFQKLQDLKIAYGYHRNPLQSIENVNSKEQIPPIAPNLMGYNELQGSSNQPNQSSDESEQNENNIGEDEEFNTSDDDVLITKKYSNIGVRSVPHNEAVEHQKIAYGYCRKPLQSVVNVNSKEQIPPIAPNLTAYNELQGSSNQPNQSSGESEQNDNNIGEDDEFNTSDDNVLITNKYSNIGVKSVPHNEAVGMRQWVPIGSGMTLIHRDDYKSINWKSYNTATRTLLTGVFNSRILTTQSLTSKPSSTLQAKPAKMRLDKRTISDVIAEVTDRFKVRKNLVRRIITTRCEDVSKMWKIRCKKLASKKNTDGNGNVSSDT